VRALLIRAWSVGLLGLSTCAWSAEIDHQPSGPAPTRPQAGAADSVRYALRVTDNNLIGLTITNYGFYGNNFISRSPSLEYPLGLGFEHMVRGGLWIGARAVDGVGAFTGVVTGAVDGSQGSASQSATEYTPAGTEIKTRSTLPNSKFFNRQAVSELDLISEFSDQPARTASGTGEPHRPIGVLVHEENYMWSFSDYQHIVFFHYTIKNNGTFPLADAWVGFYSEMASGSKNSYSSWPPTSGSGPGGWYLKKWIAYDDSMVFSDSTVAGRLFREHFCFGRPIPDGCQAQTVPYWMGLKLLGVRPGNLSDTTDKKVTFAAWSYAPGSIARDEDTERYQILSSGRIGSTAGDSLAPESGDPVTVLAVGPFQEIDPGDSIQVDFAIVGGKDIDLPNTALIDQEHARVAQRAYDRNYIVPVPPPSPLFRVVARHNALDFYWDNSPEAALDPTSPDPQDFEGYRLYIGEDRLELHRVAQFDKNTPPNDTTGFNTGFGAVLLNPPVVIDGVTYHYKFTVGSLRDGFKYFCSVTAYDLGNPEIESLESGINQNKVLAIPAPSSAEAAAGKVTVFPNPYRVEARWDQGQKVRDHYLWFTNLPARCTLRIYTLAGDMVFDTNFDGATYHGEGARGIYDPSRELDVNPPTLSGTTYGWNLITREGQAAATGLYLYSVEDRAGGKKTIGKFLIVKSDREEF
jgi:hypothetical protein